MNIKCWLFGCDWKKIGPTRPVKSIDEFVELAHMKALGQCKRCNKVELRQVWGAFSWANSEVMTPEEYFKEYYPQMPKFSNKSISYPEPQNPELRPIGAKPIKNKSRKIK